MNVYQNLGLAGGVAVVGGVVLLLQAGYVALGRGTLLEANSLASVVHAVVITALSCHAIWCDKSLVGDLRLALALTQGHLH